MFEKAKSGRDAFTFSLGGMTAVASHVAAPIVADDEINKAWDERLGRGPENRPDTVQLLEDLLARDFAPGCCRGAA